MFKKLLLSLAALLLTLSASAETKVLWQSDTEEGVLVDWGQAAFSLTPEQAAEINIGDTFEITIAGVTEGGWPQVSIHDDQSGGFGQILDNKGVGGGGYPLTVSFPITKDLLEKILANGVSFGGNGAYISAVSLTPAPFEVSPNAIWFGPKALAGWGENIGISKDAFADIAPFGTIQIVYDKDVESTLQIHFGGWSGCNVATYEFGGVASFSRDEEAGTLNLQLTPDLNKFTWGDNEYDLFTLLKEGGLVMNGPCTVKQILYIPAPEGIDPNTLWLGPKTFGWWDGDRISLSKGVFENVGPCDKIQIFYDTTVDDKLTLIKFGWDNGWDIGTNGFWQLSGLSFSNDEEAGIITINLTPDLYSLKWKVKEKVEQGEGEEKTEVEVEVEKEFNLFELLKTEGLNLWGPCTLTEVRYIPAEKPDPNTLWFGHEAYGWWNGKKFGVSKVVFEDVVPGDKIQIFYDTTVNDKLALIQFGDTDSCEIGSNMFWNSSLHSFSNDEEAGIITITLTEDLANLKWEVEEEVEGEKVKVEKEFDLFSLLKEGGLYLYGPFTLTEVRYIPFSGSALIDAAKEELTPKISEAELYDGFAKTEESFAVLTTAIEAAKTAVSAEDATVESLEAAGKAIEDAIAGLTLAEGYEYLTADMFKRYASVEEPGEGESVDCAFELLKATGLPYGDGNVDHLNWADLSKYDKLILTVKEGLPRIMMNRMIAGGNDADNREESNMLEMIPEQTDWSTQAYLTYENNVCTVNLKKIVEGEGDLEGYGFARLNVIKGAHWQDVLLTGMYLYKASDPLEMPKEALKEQIEKAKLYDGFAKTEESFAALTSAIAAAEADLSNESATEESLAKASSDLAEAVAGLTLAEGYEYLTADMFKRYASVEEPGEGTPAECAYDLFAAVNTPYGDGNVSEANWADLSDYDKFIVKMGDKNTPRVMMNRMVAGGNDSDDQEQSQMLEMVPNSTRWSTKAYTTYDEEENIFTIDLKKIVNEYGIARLNAIKYPWGVSGILTGLYLYKASDPLEMPKEALKKEIEDAKLCDKYLKTDESLANLQAAIDAAEAELSNESATEESLAKASSDLADAIAGLTLQPGYSELTKEMFKKYASVTDPGEGEPTGCDFNLNVKSGSPYGDCNSVGYLNWADLTNYDKLIITATEGNQRFCMNRLADGGQQGASMEESEMLDIQVGTDSWSAIRYLESDGNVHTVDLTKMVDDYGFARLHTIKYSWGQDGIITNIYLYKDPEAPAEYSLSFNIDDPSHVIITVDGEEITDLVAGDNEKKIADRAKLSIAPAEEYILKTVTADGKDVTLKDGSLSKTIVKAFSFNITTDDADPLAKPKKALTAIIEAASLYDSYAKTEESFSALTDAIAAAETALESDEATEASLTTAGENVTKAIDGLKLKERYSYLTPEMFKQYASVEEPGEGEVTDCTFELFNTSRTLYGDVNNNPLKWADLSDFDELIIITKGVGDLPRFCIKNDSEGSLIEINPYDGSNDATEKYQTVNEDKTEFNVDLRKIAKDGKFAHLHSIQVNGWGTGAFVTGMYLYKRPFVAVTQVTLDQDKVTLVNGESVTLVATVAPEDATEPAVTWTSSNENVATVDADGKVTAVGVGNVTITATAGDISAECAVKCNPQLGDATLDGSITITDAVDITNYVVKAKDVPEDWNEAEWREFYLLAANANKDEAGKITFADASATAELALKQPVAAAMRAARRAAAYGYADSSDALVIGRVSNASYSKVTIPVSLENSMDYVALQADIILPEGMNIEVKAGERAAATHTLMTYKFADNHIRVVLFNLGNNAFADNDAPILEIVADSYLSDCSGIVISNVLASDYKAHEYILDSRIGMSGVAGINGDNILISKAADGVVISNATGAAISIFTLDGKIIRSFVAKDDEEMINLSSGIYVVKAGDKTFKVVL